jgi:hypothetical protein
MLASVYDHLVNSGAPTRPVHGRKFWKVWSRAYNVEEFQDPLI